MITVTICDGIGNELARGRGRGDWRDIASRVYNDKIKPKGAPRCYAALVNAFPGGGTAHVQFGHWLPKANATSLSKRYVIHVEGMTF